MAYLALLVPVLALPVMLAMAAFESRCSDGTPFLRRRPAARPAPAVDGTTPLAPSTPR